METHSEYQEILVYADWQGLPKLTLMGTLKSTRLRGKEIFAFEYDSEWIKSDYNIFLDPNLGLFKGQQYLPDDKPNFGLFLDSSPDRWGRLLMKRREALFARQEKRKENTLYETDYLLGVFDGNRMGGFRFKKTSEGDFLNNQREMASPPWSTLRELEFASRQLEQDDAINDPDYNKWLNLLLTPGSSLGGARPKASVVDEKNQLWIAKFPSRYDDRDAGAWEMVLHHLAKECGIEVPEAQLLRFGKSQHTFLTKRFDRNNQGRRVHFASAMTLLGYNDGASHVEDVSYFEMIELISRYGAEPMLDFEQLWRRILFNVCVSNTDDHLRNHGFLLTEKGWRLSPAYDMNPNETGTGLKLNISENDNSLNIDLVMSVSGFFYLSDKKAFSIRNNMIDIISKWNEKAKSIGLSNKERNLMKSAFKLA